MSLVLLTALGTTILMRYAPGYFADVRELDAAHAEETRLQLQQLRATDAPLSQLLGQQCKAWLHGDLGRSRQYDVPVADLLHDRYASTVRLVSTGLLFGWLLAFMLAALVHVCFRERAEIPIAVLTATALAVPVGVLATLSLLANIGGPVLTLTLLVAVRDFKLLHSLFRASRQTPHLFYARALGLSTTHLFRVHTLPFLRSELLNMIGMSAVIALSALVPVEVIFDVHGLGHLAWVAATNRDMPVLVAMTALTACCVGVMSLFSATGNAGGTPSCD